MPLFDSPFDGAQLFYRDYIPTTNPVPFNANKGYENTPQPTLVFLHGWPMSSEMFENLLLPLCETYRLRCIAPDRRGFGKSDWSGCEPVSSPVDYTVFAADTVHLLEKLNVGPFVFIGASMGSGESVQAHFQSQFVRENCKGFLWIGAAVPTAVCTPENPTATTREDWDGILQGLRDSRAEYTHHSLPFILGNEPGRKVSEHTVRQFERMVHSADVLAVERCAQIIINADFTEKLRKLSEETNLPITCLHGDKDSGSPASATVDIVKKIIPRTDVKMYENGSHGVHITHAQETMSDLLEFVAKLEI